MIFKYKILKSKKQNLFTKKPYKNYNLTDKSMTTLLDSISNFFSAVINLYQQIPRQLADELRTMQAFLKSYDQKQLFLIQNFVRRLQTKAQTIKYLNKKKRQDLKTQPSIFDEHNKQNIYRLNNIYSNISSSTTDLFSQDAFKLNKNKNMANIGNGELQNYMKDLKDRKTTFEQYKPLYIPSLQRKTSQPLSKQRHSLNNICFNDNTQLQTETNMVSQYENQNIKLSNSAIESHFQPILIKQESFKNKQNKSTNKMNQSKNNTNKFNFMLSNTHQLIETMDQNNQFLNFLQKYLSQSEQNVKND